jgi:ABC-type dipeptide/oligopeptide/nickel transport system permease subunit
VNAAARVRQAVLRQPVVLACMAFIVAITLVALVAPLLPLADPSTQSALVRLKPPSVEYPFGTDRLGRDILSRVLWGARLSLLVGVGVVVLSAALGTVLGVVAGYFRGWSSEFVMRVTDILLSFPPLILAMVIVTVLGNNLLSVVLAISLGVVPRFARLTRGTILSIRERDFVEAARALGASPSRIIARHVLLNAVDPLIVLCTLLIPTAILTEALLSFLGLGITEPNPTWGNMINSGQIVLREAPWLTFFPGAAIVLTVLAFNLLGDALRDALDPAVATKPKQTGLHFTYVERQRERAPHASGPGHADGRAPEAVLAPGAALRRAARE